MVPQPGAHHIHQQQCAQCNAEPARAVFDAFGEVFRFDHPFDELLGERVAVYKIEERFVAKVFEDALGAGAAGRFIFLYHRQQHGVDGAGAGACEAHEADAGLFEDVGVAYKRHAEHAAAFLYEVHILAPVFIERI